MTTIRRITALCTAVLLMLFVLPTPAHAAGGDFAIFGGSGGAGGGSNDMPASQGGAGSSASSPSIGAGGDGAFGDTNLDGGGGGGGSISAPAKGGGGGAGAGVKVTADTFSVTGNLAVTAGSGGDGGNTDTGGTAGPGGSGGGATLSVTGNIVVGGVLTVTSGSNGNTGTINTGGTPGGGGTGGDANFAVTGALSAPVINLAKQDGSLTFSAGVLTVDADTTITVNGTALTDMNLTTVNVADGQTLTINNASGALTIGTLNIYGTGNVVANNNANISITTVNVEVGVSLSAPTGTAVDKNTQNLVLAFNKTVTALQGGSITLSDGGSSYIYTIPNGAAIITGTNASCVATIPFANFSPALTLEEGKTYSVSVSADAFQYAYTLGALTGTQNNAANASVGSFTVAAQQTPTTSGDSDYSGPTYTQRTLTDSATGVSVTAYLATGARLTVKDGLHKEGTCPACDEIRSRNPFLIHDISLSGNYHGPYEVYIPFSGGSGTYMVLHCNNRVLEEQTASYINGGVTTTWSKLSPFAVVGNVDVSVPDSVVVDPPKTGDAPYAWAGAVMIAGALCMLAAARKRRA